MANEKIKQAAAEKSVKLWQIAERYGMNDSNFSRKLRHELSEEEQQRIIEIINQIAAEGTA